QEDPEPPHIKEEQEELWTSQEGEQLQGLEEADITKFTFAPDPVKSEDDDDGDDEKKAQSSQLHQSQPERNRDGERLRPEIQGDVCRGSEPAGNSVPDRLLRKDNYVKTSQDIEERNYYWMETRDPQAHFSTLHCNANTKFPLSSSSSLPVNSENDDDEGKAQSSRFDQSQTEENREVEHLQTEAGGGSEPDRHLQPDNETPIFSETEDSIKPQLKGLNALKNSASHVGYNAVNKSVDCSECGERLDGKDHLQIHMKCHTGEKTFACPFCGKKFTKKSNLTTHLRVHTGEKPFTCSVCNTSFSLRCTLVNHMRVHTGEKPFSCSVCSKRFSKKANLTTHMALHTEEKPFKCSSCDKRFTWHSQSHPTKKRNHNLVALQGSKLQDEELFYLKTLSCVMHLFFCNCYTKLMVFIHLREDD
uniref:C2H2-type domain-containing protein n=1 Tax=Seriola lalandi dorsalis TaxID=1841481 RepID=A0A3B4X4S5_SERLL